MEAVAAHEQMGVAMEAVAATQAMSAPMDVDDVDDADDELPNDDAPPAVEHASAEAPLAGAPPTAPGKRTTIRSRK